MSELKRLLSFASLDFICRRVDLAAHFAQLCGLEIGEAERGDIDAFARLVDSRVSPAGRPALEAAREAFLAGGAHGTVALPIVGDDGLERHLECVWSAERGTDGEPLRLFVGVTDAGAARHAQEALRELEARHGSALKAGRMGSWETDFVEMTRHWSPEGMALFGLDLPAGCGRVDGPNDEYLNALHPDDRYLAARYRTMADEQDSFAAEYRIVRGDGTMVWLAGRGLVLSRGPGGKARRLVSIMADVSDRRLAEDDLRIERERLTLALGAGRMGVFDLDIASDVLWWSPQMYEVFGVSAETFVPTRESVARLVHPDDFEKFTRRRSEAMAGHHPFEIEARVLRPDRKTAWVAHRGQSTYDATGKPLRSFGVTMDITERKMAEQALRDADRKKDDFIATLAHELRNPLAPIRNAVTLLRRQALADDADGLRYREVIFRQVAQMSRLLDDLLDVSRIARGQVHLRQERVLLQSLFEQAVEQAQPSIDAMNHHFAVTLPAEPIELFGDGVRLAQVLSNLLINAAKYTPTGGHVALSGGLDGDEIVARVQDDGIGIRPEQMPRIFEMFGQVEDALHRSQGGLGIGLALARGIVDLHGGRIDAASDGPGTGSTFSVRLPRSRPRATPFAAAAAAEPSAPGRAAGDALRILVADDLVDIAETLAELLKVLGHHVQVAHDGAEAMRVAEAFRPDVALLDLGMPGMSGYEVARNIRSHDWGRAVTLICQTGWGQEEDRRRSREAGFDHHLVKPIDVDELAGLLRRRATTPP